jgi:hypothetical protein
MPTYAQDTARVLASVKEPKPTVLPIGSCVVCALSVVINSGHICTSKSALMQTHLFSTYSEQLLYVNTTCCRNVDITHFSVLSTVKVCTTPTSALREIMNL